MGPISRWNRLFAGADRRMIPLSLSFFRRSFAFERIVTVILRRRAVSRVLTAGRGNGRFPPPVRRREEERDPWETDRDGIRKSSIAIRPINRVSRVTLQSTSSADET